MEKILHQILGKLDGIEKGYSDVTQAIAELRHELTELRKGQDELRNGQDELRKGQDDLRNGQYELRKGQEGLIQELNELKHDHQELKHEVRTGFSKLNADIGVIFQKLDTLYAQVAHNTEQEIRISQLETDVKIIKKAVANL